MHLASHTPFHLTHSRGGAGAREWLVESAVGEWQWRRTFSAVQQASHSGSTASASSELWWSRRRAQIVGCVRHVAKLAVGRVGRGRGRSGVQ